MSDMGSPPTFDGSCPLTPKEVAVMFGVKPKTITDWANTGKLTFVRTLGGHRRYRTDEVRWLLREATDVVGQ
jgi:excisionase family DNA binding protein